MRVVRPITIEFGVIETMVVIDALECWEPHNLVDQQLREKLLNKIHKTIHEQAEEREEVLGYERT